MTFTNKIYGTLIVTEKASVARAFARYLSKGNYKVSKKNGVSIYEFNKDGERWAVVGVSGHIMNMDFPQKYNKWRSIDPKKLFNITPIYVIRKGMYKYIRVLQEIGRNVKRVILALDADVEGESIAFEVIRIISKVNPDVEFERAWFSAITYTDIINAIRTLRKPNENLANKAYARMYLDLTIGAAFTRILTRIVEDMKIKFPKGKFLSYGPCQTPVLYLVVKRDMERREFKRKKYYVVEALFEYNGKVIKARLDDKPFEKRDDAAKLIERVKDIEYGIVQKAEYNHVRQLPPKPLNTVELEKRASSYLNIRAKKALDIAETLYQNGLISYPRTDTNIYPSTLNLRKIAEKLREYDKIGWFIDKYILSKEEIKPTKGKEDDKAHPPIYPTAHLTKQKLIQRFDEEHWKIYDLVVRHFLATLSPPALLEKQTLVITIDNLPFKVNGRKIIDYGYLIVYPFETPQEQPLPYLLPGDKLKIREIKIREEKTKPPPYLSESELLALMKRYGIGTDATMQEHIHTNLKRKYFIIKRKRCIPTTLGRTLIECFLKTVPEMVLPEVRGRMEKELQKIAEGLKDPMDVVKEIKNEFLNYYEELMREQEQLSKLLSEAVKNVYSV